jgi:hypothetical protein
MQSQIAIGQHFVSVHILAPANETTAFVAFESWPSLFKPDQVKACVHRHGEVPCHKSTVINPTKAPLPVGAL